MIKTVLHIDDDAEIQALVRLALELIGGLNVIQCSSGQEALECLNSTRPDVILLDLMMPGMTGEQTLFEIRKHHQGKSIPIVLMTARAHDRIRDSNLHLDALGVISKPFDPYTLSEDLAAICAKL